MSGRRRATYGPGSWTAIAGPVAWLLADLPLDGERTLGCWDVLANGGGVLDVLGFLAAPGLAHLPSFALAGVVGDQLVVVGRAGVSAVVDGVALRLPATLTWSEHPVPLAGEVELRAGGAICVPGPSAGGLPLAVGVVAAGTLTLASSPVAAGADTTPSAPAAWSSEVVAAAPEPPEPVRTAVAAPAAEVAAPAPQVTSEALEPTLADHDETDAQPADAQPADAHSPDAQSAEGDEDRYRALLFGASVDRSVEEAAIREAQQEDPPVAAARPGGATPPRPLPEAPAPGDVDAPFPADPVELRAAPAPSPASAGGMIDCVPGTGAGEWTGHLGAPLRSAPSPAVPAPPSTTPPAPAAAAPPTTLVAPVPPAAPVPPVPPTTLVPAVPPTPDVSPGFGMTIDRRTREAMVAMAAVCPEVIGPTVQAVRCEADHPNPAHAPRCRVCQRAVAEQPPETIGRPTLGVLRLGTGDVIVLDRPVLLGRGPRPDRLVGGETPNVVRVPSPEEDISRSHVEVRLDGWDVMVVDLGSTNGTVVAAPGRPPERLRPHQPVAIAPGTGVTLAERFSFSFEATP